MFNLILIPKLSDRSLTVILSQVSAGTRKLSKKMEAAFRLMQFALLS